MDLIKIEIPKKSKYMSCIRLSTAAIANIHNFSIDKIEDIKVVISEICVFFINNIKENKKNILLEFFLKDDILNIVITDKNNTKILVNNIENEMFFLIIDSLADSYEFDYNNNKIIFQMKLD